MKHWMMLVAVLELMTMTMTVSANSKLQFKGDSFKIVQFADMHYSNGDNPLTAPCVNILPEQRPCSDKNTTDFMIRVLDAEKPDLVIFTGDNLVGRAVDPTRAIKEYSLPIIERNIPWAIVFGNHDDEGAMDRLGQMNVVTSLPFSLSEAGPNNVTGIGNYVISVNNQDGSKNVFNIYFLDSGAYSKINGIGGYDWIHSSQLTWFSEQAARFKQLNNGQIRPALAYFHIPIPEYEKVTDLFGDKQENVADADINSGFFAAIKEAGDVRATFVGHDHVNDYCGEYYGVKLCYGGGVGYGAYGKAGWSRRSRVLEFSQTSSTATTWIRLDTGERIRDYKLF